MYGFSISYGNFSLFMGEDKAESCILGYFMAYIACWINLEAEGDGAV